MSTKKICLTAMGVAMFVVLSLCLQVPVFENYYLCLGYVPMMVFCYYFGPGAGMTVGCLGVVLYCLLISGLRGMPGWAAGNLLIGLAVGVCCKLSLHVRRPWLRHLIIAAAVIISTALGILGLKSLVEMLLYSQPFLLRVAKNLYAFVADIVVMLVSIPVCAGLGSLLHKLFPEELMK